MRHTLAALLTISLVAMLAAAPAPAKPGVHKVKGHVIKVEQHVRTQNGGEFDRLTIRTRQGEEMRLHLGAGGACDGCFQVGDKVRARVQERAQEGLQEGAQVRVQERVQAGEGPQYEYQVRSMKVRREGQMFAFHEQGGRMVMVQSRFGSGPRAGRQGGSEKAGGSGSGPGRGRAGGGGPGGP